jgi:hypothetical protein
LAEPGGGHGQLYGDEAGRYFCLQQLWVGAESREDVQLLHGPDGVYGAAAVLRRRDVKKVENEYPNCRIGDSRMKKLIFAE